jgi:hypothetical protein
MSNGHVRRRLGNVLKNSTREYDVKGWCDGKLSILAPDTDDSGAQALVSNLLRRMIKSFTHLETDVDEQHLMRFVCVCPPYGVGSYVSSDNEDPKGKALLSFTQDHYYLDSFAFESYPLQVSTLLNFNDAAATSVSR